jgi:hypothetical protein
MEVPVGFGNGKDHSESFRDTGKELPSNGPIICRTSRGLSSLHSGSSYRDEPEFEGDSASHRHYLHILMAITEGSFLINLWKLLMRLAKTSPSNNSIWNIPLPDMLSNPFN